MPDDNEGLIKLGNIIHQRDQMHAASSSSPTTSFIRIHSHVNQRAKAPATFMQGTMI